MHPSDVPVFEALGGKYIAVKVDEMNGCDDCAASGKGGMQAQQHYAELCRALPRCGGRNFNVIFEEIA